MRRIVVFAYLMVSLISVNAQYRTQAQALLLSNEDSLQANSVKNKTVISGYGSAAYQRDFNKKEATLNLQRAVLFIGHQFNNQISLFTELEIEDAKVAGGENGGEVDMEQAYIKFNINPKQYFVAGLFVPRIGILNETHLPVNFNGVERPLVEELVIPATWRELGVALYGSLNKAPVNYTIAIVNGLNAANFLHGSGIREGRAEGRNATANNLAITASLQSYFNNFKFQLSAYSGGTIGINKDSATKIGVVGGTFGTPLYLGEADIQYSKNAFSAKGLATYISFPDANNVNTAYLNNTASGMFGSYVEVGYDLLYNKKNSKQLIGFVRSEFINLNASIPDNASYDGTLKQWNTIIGCSYLPIPNVVFKTDVRILNTGQPNNLLLNNSSAYQQNNHFFNLGIGYSF